VKYLNLSSSFAEEERAMRADDAQGWTWFKLISYCTRRMNGGRIADCRGWPVRLWAQLGVCKSVVDAGSPLWVFEGDALKIHGYDRAQEEKYRHRKVTGKRNVQKRWAKKTDSNGSDPGL